MANETMEQIRKAIDNFVKANKGNVAFIGSFVVFGKDDKVSDDLIVGFGDKEVIKFSLKEINKLVATEKEDFLNW